MVHRIRLNAAWHRGETLGTSLAGRISLPDESPLPADEVWYWRTFNAPTGIDRDTRLEVVFDRWQGLMDVYLDGGSLAKEVAYLGDACLLNVTARITQSHQLAIRLTAGPSGQPPCLNGGVRLQIG